MIKKIIIIGVLCSILLLLSGCAGNSQLIGRWSHTDDNGNENLFFTFNSDATGTTELSRTSVIFGDMHESTDFTWTAENGILTFTMRERTTIITKTVRYEIDGDTLILFFEDETSTLQRVR